MTIQLFSRVGVLMGYTTVGDDFLPDVIFWRSFVFVLKGGRYVEATVANGTVGDTANR
jgi:hypothetical protein